MSELWEAFESVKALIRKGEEFLTSVTLLKNGVTQDTQDTVFEVKTNAKSFLTGCVDAKNKKLVIWSVHSHQKGDMKRMLDKAVKEFGLNQMMFTSVFGADLIEKLKGFRARQLWHPQAKEKMLVLEGKWLVF